mmetsp:Transcript_12785/g.34392  ORF Transcript_12785/g.34392 Transcript_12785/m.34392 type:complete len:433 (+) Transcript_12785:174-1472(+)
MIARTRAQRLAEGELDVAAGGALAKDGHRVQQQNEAAASSTVPTLRAWLRAKSYKTIRAQAFLRYFVALAALVLLALGSRTLRHGARYVVYDTSSDANARLASPVSVYLANLDTNIPNGNSQIRSTKTSVPEPQRKIGLLFLATADLEFEELWREWFRGREHQVAVKIHCDKAPLEATSEWFNARRTRATVKTKWATPNITAAWNIVIAEALLEDPNIAAFMLLCPRTIPIQPFDFVYEALLGNDEAPECARHWFEPMSTDKWAMGLVHKSQNWRAFSRELAEELVHGGHWEQLAAAVKNGSMPWRVLGDEYFAPHVAVRAGLWRECWRRSAMWTFWNKRLGRSSPETFSGALADDSDELRSLLRAKQAGVLFARKFTHNSSVPARALHAHWPVETNRSAIRHPLMPDHRFRATADTITQAHLSRHHPQPPS